jgi:hypothetical protein
MMNKVLIGYVKSWKYLQEDIESKMAGEPKEGSVYRIIYNENDKTDRQYQIYVGQETNPAHMDTIYLGPTLKGQYYDRWEFEINVVTKENYLEFEYKPEELVQLKAWLDSDNDDLRELLTKSPNAIDIQRVGDQPPMDEKIHDVLKKVAQNALDYDKSMQRMAKSISTIVDRDTQLAMVMSELLGYVASTYKDKYEDSGKPNMARDFLVGSDSSDVAIFNALKYVQRYSTKGFAKSGKIVDIHKAIHYLLFELQRSRQQKENDKK